MKVKASVTNVSSGVNQVLRLDSLSENSKVQPLIELLMPTEVSQYLLKLVNEDQAKENEIGTVKKAAYEYFAKSSEINVVTCRLSRELLSGDLKAVLVSNELLNKLIKEFVSYKKPS